MTGETLVVVIIVAFIEFVISMVYIPEIGIDDWLYFTPAVLHRNTKMNWFGCLVCSILLFAINYGFCGIIAVRWAVYKLFHVGRKQDE